MRLSLLLAFLIFAASNAIADPDFNQGICNNNNADDKFGEICSGLGVSTVSYGFRSGDFPKRYEADCTKNPLALDRLLTKTKDEDYLLFRLVGQCELPSGLLSITDRDVILTGAQIISDGEGFVSSCANGPSGGLTRNVLPSQTNAGFVISESGANLGLSCLDLVDEVFPSRGAPFSLIALGAVNGGNLQFDNLFFPQEAYLLLSAQINSRIGNNFSYYQRRDGGTAKLAPDILSVSAGYNSIIQLGNLELNDDAESGFSAFRGSTIAVSVAGGITNIRADDGTVEVSKVADDQENIAVSSVNLSFGSKLRGINEIDVENLVIDDNSFAQ